MIRKTAIAYTLAGALALGACAPSPNPTPAPGGLTGPQIAQLISAGATSIVAVIGGLSGMSPATMQRYEADAAALATLAADAVQGVNGAQTATAIEAAAEQFLVDLGASQGILPVGVKGAIADVAAILPLLLQAYNVVQPVPPAAAARYAATVDPIGDLNRFIHAR